MYVPSTKLLVSCAAENCSKKATLLNCYLDFSAVQQGSLEINKKIVHNHVPC